jgi:hypothetical protein
MKGAYEFRITQLHEMLSYCCVLGGPERLRIPKE